MTFTEPTTYDETRGMSGPNDRAYKALTLEKVASDLRSAIEFHVGYSHSRCVTIGHPLVLAMALIAQEHRDSVSGDNRGHDPTLFEVHDNCFVTPKDFWTGVDRGLTRLDGHEPILPSGGQHTPIHAVGG